MLKAHGLSSEIRVVNDELPEDKIRAEILKNVAERGNFVIVNYHRPVLGQKGGGHISPLGAYDQESDSFLILDVNPTKALWVWVRTSTLVSAMKTFDTKENRGYLLVSDTEGE